MKRRRGIFKVLGVGCDLPPKFPKIFLLGTYFNRRSHGSAINEGDLLGITVAGQANQIGLRIFHKTEFHFYCGDTRHP